MKFNFFKMSLLAVFSGFSICATAAPIFQTPQQSIDFAQKCKIELTRNEIEDVCAGTVDESLISKIFQQENGANPQHKPGGILQLASYDVCSNRMLFSILYLEDHQGDVQQLDGIRTRFVNQVRVICGQ